MIPSCLTPIQEVAYTIGGIVTAALIVISAFLVVWFLDSILNFVRKQSELEKRLERLEEAD